jgi:hypothetical protein
LVLVISFSRVVQDIEALCTALGGSSTAIESLTLANLPITDKNCIGIAKFIQVRQLKKFHDGKYEQRNSMHAK